MLEKVFFVISMILLTLGCGAFVFVFGFCFHGYPLGESLAHAIGTMATLPIVIAISLRLWPPAIDRVADTPITQTLDRPKDTGWYCRKINFTRGGFANEV